MGNGTNHEVVFEGYGTFFAIAYRHDQLIQQLVNDRDSRKVKGDRAADFAAEKNAAIQRSAMVTVVFSALALEAYINSYAINRFSKNFFEKHLDRLNPISKWIIIPKLAVGKKLASSGQAYEKLKKLFNLRDKLVHYKTRKKRLSQLTEDDWISENQSSEALLTVEIVLKELATIDSSITIDWINSARNDPYA